MKNGTLMGIIAGSGVGLGGFMWIVLMFALSSPNAPYHENELGILCGIATALFLIGFIAWFLGSLYEEKKPDESDLT